MTKSIFVSTKLNTLSKLSKEEMKQVSGGHPGGEENHKITKTYDADGKLVSEKIDPKEEGAVFGGGA